MIMNDYALLWASQLNGIPEKQRGELTTPPPPWAVGGVLPPWRVVEPPFCFSGVPVFLSKLPSKLQLKP